MKTLIKVIKAFWQEESGLTMTEYAIAGSLVTIVTAAAFTNLGNAIVRALNQLIGYMPAA
jgi:pilus assembly protein Flp/PilA